MTTQVNEAIAYDDFTKLLVSNGWEQRTTCEGAFDDALIVWRHTGLNRTLFQPVCGSHKYTFRMKAAIAEFNSAPDPN